MWAAWWWGSYSISSPHAALFGYTLPGFSFCPEEPPPAPTSNTPLKYQHLTKPTYTVSSKKCEPKKVSKQRVGLSCDSPVSCGLHKPFHSASFFVGDFAREFDRIPPSRPGPKEGFLCSSPAPWDIPGLGDPMHVSDQF